MNKELERFVEYLRKAEKERGERRAKVERRVMEALRQPRDEGEIPKQISNTPVALDAPEGYKAYTVTDEYGNGTTRYKKLKTLAEQLQDQLRAEVTRPGDMKVIKNGKEVTIPAELFTKEGKVKPSRKVE